MLILNKIQFVLYSITICLGPVLLEGDFDWSQKETSPADSDDVYAGEETQVPRSGEWADALAPPDEACSYQDIVSASQICETLFFLELKYDQTQSCSKIYKKLRDCILSKVNECAVNTERNNDDSKAKRSIRKSLQYYLQASYCNDGSLSLYSPGHPINYCSVGFDDELARCYDNYHLAFRNDPTDKTLCLKFSEARECAKRAKSEMCQYSNILIDVRKVSQNTYRCWNPFCQSHCVDYDPDLEQKGLTFIVLRQRMQQRIRELKIDNGDATLLSVKSRTNKGIPNDCEYNIADLIGLVLNEVKNDWYLNPSFRNLDLEGRNNSSPMLPATKYSGFTKPPFANKGFLQIITGGNGCTVINHWSVTLLICVFLAIVMVANNNVY